LEESRQPVRLTATLRRRYGERSSAVAICFSMAPVDTQSLRLSLRGSGESSRPGYVASTDAPISTLLVAPPGGDVVDTVTVSVATRFCSASEFSANLQVM